MANDILEHFPALCPIDFFSLSADLLPAKELTSKKFFRDAHILPDTSFMLGEEHFAEVAMGWNEEGILARIDVRKAFEECFFPQVAEGDSVELFFDTRDLKTTGFCTRFCHHFIFLPQEVQGIKAHEMTRFRTEDKHELCDPTLLKVDSEFATSSYSLKIFIPSDCLHGYDPKTFQRLGFTYRINRYRGRAQHFAVSSEYYTIAEQPSLWSSLNLV
jgi:hypothetical protein